jgi:hypothetical protein
MRRGLAHRAHGLGLIAPEGNLRDVDVPVCLRQQANFAVAPRGVDFEAWPPVLEYTSVSSTRMFTLRPLDMT